MDIKPAKPAIGKTAIMRIMMTAGNGASRKLANFSFDIISMSALVGMDIITLGDFHLTNNGNTVFKFTIPPESRKAE